jgi:WD40 repeat protein
LLSFDRDPLTRGPTVEVAHEALLREWRRLREWLDESPGRAPAAAAVGDPGGGVAAGGEGSGFLLRGSRLDQFEAWAAGPTWRSPPTSARTCRPAWKNGESRRPKPNARPGKPPWSAGPVTSCGRSQVFAEGQSHARATQQSIAEAEADARATQQSLAEDEARARATAESAALAQEAIALEQSSLAAARELALASNLQLQSDPELSILLALQSLHTEYTLNGEEALRYALESSRVKHTFFAHPPSIWTSLNYSPDGSRMATGGGDGSVKIWDVSTGENLMDFPTVEGKEGRTEVVFSPDGNRLAAGFADGSLLILDAVTGQILQSLAGHSSYYNSLTYSPYGATLASANHDGTARVWDAQTGGERFSLDAPGGDFFGENYSGFLPGGEFLIVSDVTRNTRIVDPVTGTDVISFPSIQDYGMLAISPDATLLAGIEDGSEVHIWDLATLMNGTASAPLYSLAGHSGIINTFAFSPIGNLFATGGQDLIVKIWSISAEEGEELMTLSGHKDSLTSVQFSPDSASLASIDGSGTAKIWDITPEGRRELLTLAKHEDRVWQVAYSTDSTRLATSSFDGKVRIWDAETGELLQTLTGHKGRVYGIAFHPDGTRLVSSGSDFSIRIWDISTGQELMQLLGHEDIQGEDADYLVGGLHPGVLAVAYSPDGRWIASTGEDSTTSIWDSETGTLRQTLSIHPDRFGGTNVVFSPDGKRLATATDSAGPIDDKDNQVLVMIWDTETWQNLVTLSGFGNRVWGLDFSPDSSQLATAAPTGGMGVQFWDTRSGEEILLLPGGASIEAHRATFSPDGKHMITAGVNLPTIWDLGTLSKLSTLPGPNGTVTGLSFSPDGTRLATAGRDGTARIYLLEIDDLMNLAEERLTRWFTSEECRQFLHVEQCPPEP